MKYKILVAEDEAIERKMMCMTLTDALSEFCELLEASDGEQALELYQKERPEIAVLDIEMPGIGGLQVAQKIRETDSRCAILFLTGFDKFSYAKQAISVRALDYLLKPYNEEELVCAVEEAMRYASQFDREGATPEHPVQEKELPQQEENDENRRLSLVREEIRACVEAHYKENLSMQDVAQYMRYSDGYFCRLFKQCFRVNFSTYLNEYRIEKAKEMMLDIRLNVKEISIACGYNDATYFCRVFKRVTGMTPSEYRLSVTGVMDNKIN